MHGELLLVPGIKIATSTIWEIMYEAGIEAAPDRAAISMSSPWLMPGSDAPTP